MATLKVKIVTLPTYDVTSMAVADASTYPPYTIVSNPNLLVTPPGFPAVSIPFIIKTYMILTSDVLGISDEGVHMPLPDGVYNITYSFDPVFTNFDKISIMRVDQIQEKFDNVFMGLDMMECEQAVKEQTKVTLNTIYLLIQGSVAAANNCATIEAYKLYDQANKMLDSLINKNCGCSGNNYLINFY